MMPGVLFVGNLAAAPDANPPVCLDLARLLSGDGWRVIETSRKHAVAARLYDMVHTAWRTRGDYQVAHIDVFSGRAFLWAEAVSLAVAQARKPYVLTLRGGRLPEFSSTCQRRVRRLLGGASAVTAPSRYLVDQMSSYRSDTQLLPNPLNVNRYPFRRRRPVEPKLVWLRAFHSYYNPALAVMAFAEIARDNAEAKLAMVGPDKGDGSLPKVKELMHELRLGGLVSLPGPIPKTEVPIRLSESDIFLNTADFDNTPVSVLEALACGLVVISTNVGGIPYLLEHGRDALLIPPNDPEALVRAIRLVLHEPDLAATLSENGRRKAEQLDWSAVLPQWKSLLLASAGAGSL